MNYEHPVRGNPLCTDCGLHRTCQTVCIMGRGVVDPKLMLIGEAPGEEEDKLGEPFIGPAGQLLEEVMKDLAIEENTYITNVVKCRPPGNRNPSKGEVDACWKYLEEEITKVYPYAIATLGVVATSALLGVDNVVINNCRGIWHTISINKPDSNVRIDFDVMPTYHPAYVLRNREVYDIWCEDIAVAYLKRWDI